VNRGKKVAYGESEQQGVELPLLAQLQAMGWVEISAEADGRASPRDTLLVDRLTAAMRRINLRHDRPWLDDMRLAQALGPLLRPAPGGLIETNRAVTELLLSGVQVSAPEDATSRRDVRVHYIDWDNPANNDFAVIRQFRVELPGGQQHRAIKPDLVLFVNGIPLVVIEAKRQGSSDPIMSAITQLRRYANQRAGDGPPEGSDRLFHTNQFVVATSYDQARVGTFTSGSEHFAEWKTVAPASPDQVRAELDRADVTLSTQETLAAGMLRPAHLLDLVRHFTLFMTVNGATVKLVARYQQYRAVRAAITRLRSGATRAQDGTEDRRGGIIWHTQGSGKSLTMVFLVRAMRTDPELAAFKIVVVTDRTQLQRQLAETAALTDETVRIARRVSEVSSLLAEPGKDLVFAMIQKYRGSEDDAVDAMADAGRAMAGLGELNTDERIVVLIDEAHRTQSSDLHASLRKAVPNAALIGFTGTPIVMGRRKKTAAIFGDYIDRYTLAESEADGATVPIMYEGRTTKAAVRDGNDLDELFEDMFDEQTPDQQAQIRKRWGTKNHVLEATELIGRKATDMLRHYVDTVLPNRFKAQVVAVSRKAAVRYRTAFLAARDQLVAEIDALPADQCTPDALDRATQRDTKQARLVRAQRHRDLIARLDFVPVVSGKHNDEPRIAEWTNETAQRDAIERFRTPLGNAGPDGSEVAFLIVKSMLLTGFDAPVEQVLYLDRHIKEAELLQAIARVNRTAPGKPVGYVIDYFGVAEHLKVALAAYAKGDVEGILGSVADEVPRLADRRQAVRELFQQRGIDRFDTDADVEACVQLLADERLRAEFEARFALLATSMEIVLPRPAALAHAPAFKRFGRIRYEARRRYREDDGFDVSLYGEKVRRLIDGHVTALGVSTRIPPVSITAADFDTKVGDLAGGRAKASEMEHAIRHHIREHLDEDPVRYESLAERLDSILKEFEGQWEQLELELRGLVAEARAGRADDGSGLDPERESPFFDLLRRAVNAETGRLGPGVDQVVRTMTVDLVERISTDISIVGFWENAHAQDVLRKTILHRLDSQYVDGVDLFAWEILEQLADRVVELARNNRARLAAPR
jgi:type I restriction enzyme R subunit